MKQMTPRLLRALCCGAGVACFAPGLAGAQTLSRGPYPQLASPTSVTLVWRTLLPSDARVIYGASPAMLNLTATRRTTATQHELKLTGLSPGTRYYYAVGSSTRTLAGADSEHYFDTAPAPGTRAPFRMWIVGDSGTGDLNQLAVRDSMLRFVGGVRPDLFLHMGDMAYSDGTDLEFQFRFFAPYQDILRNTVCWPTLGNHEGSSSDSGTESGPYYDAFVLPRAAEAGGVASGTEAYYSFDYANVHFVVLDSHDSSRDPRGAMLRWLQTDLAATRQEWVIAYWHHPPYTKGSHNSDTEGQLIQMRENALPILEAAGVDLVLAGHSHIYERSYLIDGAYDTPTTATGHILDSGDGKQTGNGAYVKHAGQNAHQGAVYVVAGHGGASLRRIGTHPLMYFTERRFGSCILDVDGASLTLKNIRSDGVVSDEFTMRKVTPPQDGGVALDAGLPPDAGARDAGIAMDAGLRDAGIVMDAGVQDAGTARDGGVHDAGTAMDAGTSEDAGAESDGGAAMDAGNRVDAGSTGDAGLAGASRGGCATQDVTPSVAAWLLLLTTLLAARRRRRPTR